MKATMMMKLTAVAVVALMATACDLFESDEPGPNELDGNWDIELTEVGQETDAYFTPPGGYDPAFDNVEASGVVVSNKQGVVTYQVNLKFDTTASLKLDTLLGLQALPAEGKKAILDAYLERFGATLDTSDKDHMSITATVKAKITDKGIQEFISSGGDESRPFTVVKYDAAVGDVYTFRTFDGRDVKREVVAKSTTDDYPIGFWLIKVIKVKQTEPNDPLTDALNIYANHKFGLVGMEMVLKDGRTMKVTLFPPTL